MNKLLASLSAAFALPACVLLPSTTPVIPQIRGSVVDAQTRKPVAAATVTATRAGRIRRATTSASGQFTLRPASQWHYLAYMCSPGVVPVPWHLRGDAAPMTILVSAPGYQESTMTFEPRKENSLLLQLPESIQVPLRH